MQKRIDSGANKFELFSQLAAITTSLIGVLVVAGWNFDIPVLKTLPTIHKAMNPTVALCFMLSGLSLVLLHRTPTEGRISFRYKMGRASALAVALIGLFRLGEYLSGWSVGPGIDALLFQGKVVAEANRLAPNTALAFLFLAISFLFLDVKTRRGNRPAEALAFVVLLISFAALVGRLYGVPPFYDIWGHSQMTLNSSLVLVMLTIGVLCARSDMSLVTVLASDTVGGVLARRLLPAVIGLEVVLGWLRLEGQKANLYGTAFGATLFVVAITAILVVVIFLMARLLNRTDAERSAAELKYRRQNEILESIIENVGHGLVVADKTGKFIIFNSTAEEIIGLGATDTGPQGWTQTYGVFYPDGATPYPTQELPIVCALRGEIVQEQEQFIRNANVPEGVLISVSARPVMDEKGEIRAGVAVFRDITQSRRDELELQRTKAFLDSIVENIPNMIFVKEASELRFVRFNRAGEELLGYSQEELMGKSDYNFFPKEQADSFTAKDRTVLKEGKLLDIPEEPVETRLKGTRILHTKKIPVYDSQGEPQYLLGISEDITEQVEAQKRFQKLLEAAPDSIVVVNDKGMIQLVNSQTEKLFGYSADELVGQPVENLMPERFRSKHVGNRSGYLEAPRVRSIGTGLSLFGLSKDGSEFPVEISLSPIEMEGKTHVIAAIRDMTARKKMEEELKMLNQDLKKHSGKLEEVNKELEAFSYSVSHDLRAPLRSIDGFSLALMEDYADKVDENGKDFLKRIRSATQRMGNLIDDLLGLSRVTRGEMQLTEVNLSSEVKKITAELQEREPERQVTFDLAGGLSVKGDPRLLRVALTNLLSNAWKYTSKTADPKIEFGARHLPDGRLALYVRDNGAGFDMAYVDKLFGIFQRLHGMEEFEGNGVGLATVKRIVQRHGGEVWAEGKVGKGATFYFTLEESGAYVGTGDLAGRRQPG